MKLLYTPGILGFITANKLVIHTFWISSQNSTIATNFHGLRFFLRVIHVSAQMD